MIDNSYLEAFYIKILREAQRILRKGFTAEDIDEFIGNQFSGNKPKHTRRLPKGVRKKAFEETRWGKREP